MALAQRKGDVAVWRPHLVNRTVLLSPHRLPAMLFAPSRQHGLGGLAVFELAAPQHPSLFIADTLPLNPAPGTLHQNGCVPDFVRDQCYRVAMTRLDAAANIGGSIPYLRAG